MGYDALPDGWKLFILVFEVFVHLVFMGSVACWLADAALWCIHRYWPHQPWTFRYPCGCAGEISRLPRAELEIFQAEGSARVGVIHQKRMMYRERCEAHQVLESIRSLDTVRS